ncbi:hypothetical protein GCM10008961_12320 [Deinococcus knuensis]|uniref:Pvc16 N-terminal domain-containing protein n=1 Tax=Deinococcus knuensis TaxID=1837380 RepID=A0ABQ2SDB3_9DEIO|nr:hypothetical protein GCM10008961_12320 [Deinococcus knuensis]
MRRVIDEIQQSLKELVYTEAGLPRDALDIRFAAPTPAWVSGLTRPTLNFFMHDLRENASLRSMEFTHAPTGLGVTRTLAPRRMDLRFLVTVFFKAQLDELGRDEWQVLWRVLAALMRQDEWEDRYLPAAARTTGLGILGQITPGDTSSGVFSSLGQTVRPHLNYTVTVPLDLGVTTRSPMVLERDLSFRAQATPGEQPPVSRRIRSSWHLLDELGQPIADALVRSEGGDGSVRAFSDEAGLVHLNVSRSEVQQLRVLTLDGRALTLPAHDSTDQPTAPGPRALPALTPQAAEPGTA